MRDLSPQQRERVLQNSRAFQNFSPDKQSKIRQQFNQWDRMTPQQRATMRENEGIWRRLTPEQQQHIKNDVLPRWRQLPWDRQQVMKQKLGVLQHMPEYARNQRLNDPNFTRGMTDEEKSVLHDLAHTHVGAPEPPAE
jgi:ferric-dicitrate binding protein FerR (iron transport regulator)